MINNFYDISGVRLYIDPATTSYVIQIIAGIIIACGAAIGVFWNKLGRIFKKKKLDNIEKIALDDSGNEKKILKAEDLLDDDSEDNK